MTHTISVRNPRNGRFDYEIRPLSRAEIAEIAAKKREAQKNWFSNGIDARCTAVNGFADALEANQGAVSRALETDTGRKAIARSEILGVIASLRGWAIRAPSIMPKPAWQTGVMNPNFKHTNEYLPYPLVGVISPWNFPLTLSFIDAIPALLAGAGVIIKPSEITPRFADALTPVIDQTELKGILTFIQGGGETGANLIDYVDCICFTGSVPTGRKVAARAAENLIPANLELGGKDPLIIAPGADLEAAASLALRSSVLATGQACQSIERVYVHRSEHDEFVKLLTTKAKAVTLDYPEMGDGDLGPFIDGRQADIVSSQITDAIDKGAILHCGGELLGNGGGKWLLPTVLSSVTHQMKVMKAETFGPVIPVMAYETIEEAAALANDTEYGLSGGVFAGSIEAAHEVGRHIEAGAISLMDAALTGQYFEAGKQAFKNSGLGPSRMGQEGFQRFFRQKAYIANTVSPLTLKDFTG